MKLHSIISQSQIDEAIVPVSKGSILNEPYNVYVDMDGVLADLRAAVKYGRNGKSSGIFWQKPEALAMHLKNPNDKDEIMKFFLGGNKDVNGDDIPALPKIRGCDQVWTAAAELAKRNGGKLFVLTALPDQPKKKEFGKIDRDAVKDGKIKWCKQNLSPSPDDVLVVDHGKKVEAAGGQLSETDVLVDDSEFNITAWVKAGGTAIPHIPGSFKVTVNNLKTPGKLGAVIDLSIQRAEAQIKSIISYINDNPGLDLSDDEAIKSDIAEFEAKSQAIGGLASKSLKPLFDELNAAMLAKDTTLIADVLHKMQNELNDLSLEGFPTRLKKARGKDKFIDVDDQKITVSVRSLKMSFDNPSTLNKKHGLSNEITVPILSPFTSDDSMLKKLVGLMKKEYNIQQDRLAFIELVAGSLAKYYLQHGPDGGEKAPDMIHVPASSVKLATDIAQAVASKFQTGLPILIWRKQPDPTKVRLNETGLQEYCNPKSGEKKSIDKSRAKWMDQAQRWLKGELEMKHIDQFARRGNLLNLYVPPEEYMDSEFHFADKNHLIIDDITTFQTTISNISWYLLSQQAMSVTGAVAWRFD